MGKYKLTLFRRRDQVGDDGDGDGDDDDVPS